MSQRKSIFFVFSTSDKNAMLNFKGMRFPVEVILVCIRWYAAYSSSTRNLEEMMEERGVLVDHSTVSRWAIRFLPLLEKVFRKHKGEDWKKCFANTSVRIFSPAICRIAQPPTAVVGVVGHKVAGVGSEVPQKCIRLDPKTRSRRFVSAYPGRLLVQHARAKCE